MPRILKTILIIVSVIGIGLIALCVWGFRMVTGSLPITHGNIEVSGIDASVDIYRDGYHIPHIFADDEYDLFFAQGFVTAQDRLWQMELWKRAASGRLSEIFGKETLAMDSLMCTIGIRRTANHMIERVSESSRSIYEAYSSGVNAYIATTKQPPVEFLLLDIKPTLWSPADCVAISRWMAWNQSIGWKTDAVLGALVERVGKQKLNKLFPKMSEDRWAHQSISPRISQTLLSILDYQSTTSFRFPQETGSNAWVISGQRSYTEKPLLANDPHLSLTNPSIFYENHLVGGRFNVSGVSLPGIPGIIIGQNEHIAWGITNLYADELDLYVEHFQSSNSLRYRGAGITLEAESISEIIPVRMDSSISLKIRETVHGPIVSDVLPLLDTDGVEIAVRWTGHDFSDEGLAYIHLNLANNWNAFREALRDYGIAPQVFLFADRQGNIGLQAAGAVPVRPSGSGSLPGSGIDRTTDWKGFIPFDSLPSIYNPTDGILVSANQAWPTQKNEYRITVSWTDEWRHQRIRTLLENKPVHSIMDFKRIQSDVRSEAATELLPYLLATLLKSTLHDAEEKTVLETLSRWDGQMRKGSIEAATFEVFIQRLIDNVFRDELGDTLYRAFLNWPKFPHLGLFNLMREPSSLWFDDVETTAEETRQDIILKSFQEAVSFLKVHFNTDPHKWTWGALHTLDFVHPLGQHPLLGGTFNLGPFHLGGSFSTVYMTAYSLEDPYSVKTGAAARMIFDLANPDNSISVIPTGQSGQPMDEHYRDQIQLYIGNLYHPNLFDSKKVFESGWTLYHLQPGEHNER